MEIIKVENDIQTDNFNAVCRALYGKDGAECFPRFSGLLNEHIQRYGTGGVFFSSSGRIEVIGNHTDHNRGKVLTAAISVDTLALVTKTDDKIVSVASSGYPSFEVDLEKLDLAENEKGTSLALVKGVAKGLADRGYQTGGFKATVISDVFKGAGVSSSASFEVLIAQIFNEFYNGGRIPKIVRAIVSQYAENVYFGKPSGLMDQSAIALGGVSEIDFYDLENPRVTSCEWTFSDLDICIVNTGGDHSDLTENYAAIRYEMETVAKCFNRRSLREVEEADFYRMLPDLQTKVSGRALLRAMHFFDENKRIDRAVLCLARGDEQGFLDVVNSSGESSYTMLQNCYAEGDRAQRIPLALSLSRRIKGVKAVRVHGGGFMGTILAFVQKAYSDDYIDALTPVFGRENIFKLNIRDAGATAIDL